MAAGPEISIDSSAMITPSAVIDQSVTGNEVSSVKNLDRIINSNDNDGCVVDSKNGADSDPKSETNLKEFVDILSLKLNPMAKEFFPSYYFKNYPQNGIQNGIQCYPNNRRRKHNYSNTQRSSNGRAFRAQREDSIKRTVYVSEIDHNVTEEQLAALFSGYGHVLDCRVCGDPHSRLRFAFVEFADESSARGALNLAGTMLGFSQITVLPSKTAILPVNPTFLPRSEDEREMCARTVYCTNIDKKVSQTEVKNFFETRCGEVSRLRLLGDNVHSTRIAFVEFLMAESAIMALDCCGQPLGAQPIRVSPSKTPVRPRVARPLSGN